MASHDPIENSCIMVSMWGKILNVFTVLCVCVVGGGVVRVQGTCHIVHIVQLTLCIDFLGKK